MINHDTVKKVLEMHEQGIPAPAIAQRLNLSKQRVYYILQKPINDPQREVIYPNIKAWMMEHQYTINDLTRMCGITYGTAKNMVTGASVSKTAIDAFLKASGMKYEYAFMEETETL